MSDGMGIAAVGVVETAAGVSQQQPHSSFSSQSPSASSSVAAVASQLHLQQPNDLILHAKFWHDLNHNLPANATWDEMLKFLNDTILGTSGAGAPLTAYTYSNRHDEATFNFNSSGPKPFFGDFFQAFHQRYFPIHGYLSIFICTFGIISNLINIAVLSQKVMRTPTNAILTALAAVDAVVMAVYVPYSLHEYLLKNVLHELQWRSFAWMLFKFFTINFLIYLHSISVWLTITLAVFRYIAVMIPSEVQKFCSMQRAMFAIASSFVVTGVICIPSYLCIQIERVSDQEIMEQMDASFFESLQSSSNQTIASMAMYRIDESDLSKENANIPRLVSFYAFSVFAKLVPCFVLTYFSIMLVRALLEVERRKFNLKNPSATAINGLTTRTTLNINPEQNSAAIRRSSTSTTACGSKAMAAANETTQFLIPPTASSANNQNRSSTSNVLQRPPVGRDRTTRMLLVILVSFLITEFPSGLLALFSCFSADFFTFVYVPLGDLMDILALFNSSVNFIIYCSMSRMFRKTFSHMLIPRALRDKWKSFKARRGRGAGFAPSTTRAACTERTLTYYPMTERVPPEVG